ncbi:type II/IV secretion system ATPase subunit [Candidatus Woesearchaeota archaeon]|nr:type II/IV secretion system ATPase subunit [Candidatus Woesearchaeota archaeon]USN43860.1 MAG: type II/IV secretion system ATPase subunit [Candidatus Woesearchaeota archaeon]
METNDPNENFQNGVLELDLRSTPTLSSPIDPEFKKKYSRYNFERLIVRTKYLTKQYDSDFRLISVEPFFVDVSLYNPHKIFSAIDNYRDGGIIVRVLDVKDIIENFYEITIEEYYFSLQMIKNIYKDAKVYEETGETKNKIIQRWYKEFGILEYLLKDKNVLEVNINPPGFNTPIRIIHEKYGECVTNIYPSQSFLDYFVTRLKMKSGRPLNKVSPELDTEVIVGGIKARVAVVVDPFSIFGPGFSLRKHREKPWTLELFMYNKTINALFSGFMSLVIAHGRSYIMAGPRGSGKTSLMGASLLEIPTNDRLVTIEDTQEIPIETFKKLGYDILSLKVRSALMDEGMEIDFEKGLRTTLRLGDSCLILGEIRGKEAKVLYEAMRVGAMSNVVTGTIHADTAYGVYDRVVNDLGVTKGSFKVTDFIVLINLIKDASGSRKVRRVVGVVEVLKDWEDEPQFQTLFQYNPDTDDLEPTQVLKEGKSIVLKELLKNTRTYKNMSDVITDIELRSTIKNIILNAVGKKTEFLEAEHTKALSTMFLKLYRNITDFSNKAAIRNLYQEYEQMVKRYLNEKHI